MQPRSIPPIDPFIGVTIPSESRPGVVFRIERKLGEGGTAMAYFATRFGPEGTSPVVMKIILPAVILRAGTTGHMVVQKESVALGRLNERIPPTPFVVRLLDTGSLEQPNSKLRLPWLAIEYVHGGVDGATLEERVQRNVERMGCSFDPDRTMRFLSHASEGLREVHAVGVIHRDINPNNVLCCGNDQSEIFKISDFGIARSIGADATFGGGIVGTPGYLAPEQASKGESGVGFFSDIFSLAAMTFFVLTGEAYFPAKSLFEALAQTVKAERRSIRETQWLAPEIREDNDTCDAIDSALALASAVDPGRRPHTPKAFAASVLPWLSSCPPTRRSPLVSVPNPSVPPTSASGWTCSVRHPIVHDWVLSRVGWDGDGHCLGASTRGLVFFDGTTWVDVPLQTAGISRIRFATRIGAGRWLLGGDAGTVAEYSRGSVSRILHTRDPSITLLDGGGELGDLAAMIASRPGAPPMLGAVSGGRWLRALEVPSAASLLSLSRVDDERWLVCGRTSDARGFAGLYSPLEWSIQEFPSMETRSLTACVSRPERDLSIAVGAQGAVMILERGNVTSIRLPGAPDLSSVALDVLGRAWVGAAGELWFGEGASGFRRVWHEPNWQAPFVSIFADAGMVFAATADGAVLECRSTPTQLFAGS